MSSIPFAAPLYSVPAPIQVTQARLGTLLRLRRLARQGFDRAMAAPRAAAGYVLRALRSLIDGMPAPVVTALSWVGGRVAGAATLVRAIGVVPVLGAMITVPPVRRVVGRVLTSAGHLAAKVGAALWQGTSSLLRLCGAENLASRITAMGSTLLARVEAARVHPDMQILLDAGHSIQVLLQQVVRGFAVHRALQVLLPIAWLRVLIEVAGMPLLLDTRLYRRVTEFVRGSNARTKGTATSPVVAMEETAPAEPCPAPVSLVDIKDEQDRSDVVRNRAERREQQRQDTRNKRIPPKAI